MKKRALDKVYEEIDTKFKDMPDDQNARIQLMRKLKNYKRKWKIYKNKSMEWKHQKKG